MSFLAPLFLAGFAAVALPILFHLIHRTPRGRVIFSSLMFLSPTPPRLTKRRRIDSWLLLMLRGLALLLLALAFARPFLRQAASADIQSALGQNVVVLVDTSASMRRADLWRQARGQIDDVLEKAGPMDRVALFTFDRRATAVMTFEEWAATPESQRGALVEARLADVSPGWGATDLGGALVAAADTLEQAAVKKDAKQAIGPRRVVLISDLQQGAQTRALQAYEWPDEVTVDVHALTVKKTTNAGLQFVLDADQDVKQEDGDDDRPRVRVTNSADSAGEQFRLRWDVDRPTPPTPAPPVTPKPDQAAEPPASEPASQPDESFVDVYVPPGQRRTVRAPKPPADAFGGSSAARLVLEGDDHDFDNTAHRVPPSPRQVTVLYLGDEGVEDARQPLFYLTRAFPPTRWRQVRIVPMSADAAPPPADAAAAQLIVIAQSVPANRLPWLRDSLQRGKTTLVLMKTAELAATVAALAGVADADKLGAVEAPVAEYAMLGEIDFTHPLFAPFADPRFSDFTKVHFWKYRRLDAAALPDARVVARFDRGDPALIEAAVGKGRMFVLASGWHPDDSQLALSTKFVPLLTGILESGSPAPDRLPLYHVGDAVALPGSPASDATTRRVTKPDGDGVELKAGATQFTEADEPGVYTVITPGETGGEPVRFAVNTPPAESETAPMPGDELERLGVRLTQPTATTDARADKRQRQLLAAELERRHKIWRWLIFAGLAVLVFETWLAGRTARAAMAGPTSDAPPVGASS